MKEIKFVIDTLELEIAVKDLRRTLGLMREQIEKVDEDREEFYKGLVEEIKLHISREYRQLRKDLKE